MTETYHTLYTESVKNPNVFWKNQAKRLSWFKSFTKVKETSFTPGQVSIKWFQDGELNACYNCVDRHIEDKGDQVAILFEGDEEGFQESLTYTELHEKVCRFANGLKSVNVKKGDTVVIYLPMMMEGAIAMLACARIGAVHSVVFGGFSGESLASRIQDCGAKVLITCDTAKRGGKNIPFKETIEKALSISGTECIEHVIMLSKNDGDSTYISMNTLMEKSSPDCPCEVMNAEDPLFILYTSGSTGKPKGVLHTTGGYLLYAALTHEYVFDYQPGDVHFCTADIGWITGHSYVVYGPLCNGATTVMFEGIPGYPDYGRLWRIIDKYQVNIFYTAPTAIRTLRSQGDYFVKSSSRKSLRVLGTVGEPIDHTAWQWYFDIVGDGRCYVADTWWQTETGGHLLTPIAKLKTPLEPGSVTTPFFGIQAALVDNDGHEIKGAGSGNLVLLDSWPGQARTLFKDHSRFEETYFSIFPGKYFSGDGATRDEKGFYTITGRVDDVLNVSGHRLGTNELESAITEHAYIAEAAVVGFPHEIKGQGIYAYVVAYDQSHATDHIKQEIIQHVRKLIGPIATIDKLQFTDSLPKTRSGKVMRRILRKIAENQLDSIGDTSTLSDPNVVERIIQGRL